MNWLTKKKVFIFSLLFFAVPLSMIVIQENCDYDALGLCWKYWSEIGMVGMITFWPSVLFFVLTIIILPFSAYVFEIWKKFAIWAVPITLILTWLLLSIDTGGDIGGAIKGQMIAAALLAIYLVYLLISLIIIARAWRKERKNRQ